MKIGSVLSVIKPEYVYLRLKPNNSIRNNNTHHIARTIASLYRNLFQIAKQERAKVIKLLGKEFVLPTGWSFTQTGKVSYFIYIEQKKIEFYFIVPRHHLTILKEKLGSAWNNVTIDEVDTIPTFKKPFSYQLGYEKEDAMSLQTDRRDSHLLNAKLNVVDVLEEGDQVGVFYNFIPISQFQWRSEYRNTMQKVKDKQPIERNKKGFNYLLKLTVSFLTKTIDELIAALNNKKETSTFETLLERLNGRHEISESTSKKGRSSVVDTQIVVMSGGRDTIRTRNNARSLAQSFDILTEDNRLNYKRHTKDWSYTDTIIKGADRNKVGDEEAQNFIQIAGRDILERYNFIEKVETTETKVPDDLQKGVFRLGESTFRGHKQPAYLTTDKEFKQLSLVVIGPNRAGKSTFFANLGRDAVSNGECMIVFDFIRNCELSDEISSCFPKDKVLTIDCADFDKLQGLGYNEVKKSMNPFEQYNNVKLQANALSTLVNSINLDDASLTPKMERYLDSAALTVFMSGGSFLSVFEALQDHEVRHNYMSRIPKEQMEYMKEYVGYLKELDKINNRGEVCGTRHTEIVGIIDRLNRLKKNTYMELMLKKYTNNNIDLVEEMQKNQVICIRMPESAFTTKEQKDICCTYWITKIHLALQIRGSVIKDRDKVTKVNMVIDELYQVRNTERYLRDQLSQLPKFGLKPVISCHYLNQLTILREELRSANPSYMLLAGCDSKNFREMEAELKPFTLEDLLNMPRYHSLNLIKTREGYGRFITKLPAPVKGV